MSSLPIVLGRAETLELVKIDSSKEQALTLAQWELVSRLVGSILRHLRYEFAEHGYAVGTEIRLTPVRELYSAEVLGEDVPFFSYRM